MKPSELKKDSNFSGRINKDIKKELRRIGITEQEIINDYIDSVLKVDIKIRSKLKKEK